MEIKFLDLSLVSEDPGEVAFWSLFKDNFNRYERVLFSERGEWLAGQEMGAGDNKPTSRSQREIAQKGGVVSEKATPEILMSGSTIDDAEYASSSKSFKLEDPDTEAGLMVKRFSLPVRTPFCVSAENFSISAVNQDSRGDDNRIGLSGREESFGPNGFFRFGPVLNDFCGSYVFDMGIHGGRGDYSHSTYGCIRTTDWFMEWLLFWDFFDPIEGLFVI